MWWVGCHFPGLPNSRLPMEHLQGWVVVDPCYFHWGLQHMGNHWPQLHCQVPIPSCTAVPDDIVKYSLVKKRFLKEFLIHSIYSKSTKEVHPLLKPTAEIVNMDIQQRLISMSILVWTDTRDRCLVNNHRSLQILFLSYHWITCFLSAWQACGQLLPSIGELHNKVLRWTLLQSCITGSVRGSLHNLEERLYWFNWVVCVQFIRKQMYQLRIKGFQFSSVHFTVFAKGSRGGVKATGLKSFLTLGQDFEGGGIDEIMWLLQWLGMVWEYTDFWKITRSPYWCQPLLLVFSDVELPSGPVASFMHSCQNIVSGQITGLESCSVWVSNLRKMLLGSPTNPGSSKVLRGFF